MSPLLFLIHWNQAEAEGFAAELRAAGWRVETEAEDGARAYRRIRELAPTAVVVNLDRKPSHGRITAESLRGSKATREIPIYFVGGDDASREKTKASLPHGVFLSADELEGALQTLRAV